ncbi:uncharacterized protein VTP21DRAFT_9425 [Calcarisporiella thermophila]|uniref:uncharacterized protein n=1 Tax=Calcarisporiella thermophila TaxID=911321 RepID=UPI003742B2CE
MATAVHTISSQPLVEATSAPSSSLIHASTKYATSVPEAERLAQIELLRFFLATSPTSMSAASVVERHHLPNGENISCVLWGGLFYITSTDILRALTFRFEAFGRPIVNMKKFEEGVFSDLRQLKSGTHAVLEEPKSEFLDVLFMNNCIRTQKKQKVYYWFAVPHDKLFVDALERDLRRERKGLPAATLAVSEPALSMSLDQTDCLFFQFKRATLGEEEYSGGYTTLTMSVPTTPADPAFPNPSYSATPEPVFGEYDRSELDPVFAAADSVLGDDVEVEGLRDPLMELTATAPSWLAQDAVGAMDLEWGGDMWSSPKLVLSQLDLTTPSSSAPSTPLATPPMKFGWPTMGSSAAAAAAAAAATPTKPPSFPAHFPAHYEPYPSPTPLAAVPRAPKGRRRTTVSNPSDASHEVASGGEHEEHRPFICPFTECQRRFKRQQHWKRHIRSSHTSIRPFTCPHCPKAFTRSDSLTVHIKTHFKAREGGRRSRGASVGQEAKEEEAAVAAQPEKKTDPSDKPAESPKEQQAQEAEPSAPVPDGQLLELDGDLMDELRQCLSEPPPDFSSNLAEDGYTSFSA